MRRFLAGLVPSRRGGPRAGGGSGWGAEGPHTAAVTRRRSWRGKLRPKPGRWRRPVRPSRAAPAALRPEAGGRHNTSPRSGRVSRMPIWSNRSSTRRRRSRRASSRLTIATADGKTATGLLAEDRPDRVVLRDPSEPGKLVTIAAGNIEARRGRRSVAHAGGPWPTASARGRSSSDLIRYLRRGSPTAGRPAPGRSGPTRACSRPRPLPEYGARTIDPRRDDRQPSARPASQRGEAIYAQVCTNCSRDDRPPRLDADLAPLRLGGRSRTAATPHAIYRTLTHGFGLMPAQSGLVPRQKYGRDPLHPRGIPPAEQPLPVSPARPRTISPACLRVSRSGRSRSFAEAVARDGLRLNPDGDRRGRPE